MTCTDPTANLKQPPSRGTLVSVVVPTFNRAALLPTAINSVLAQTWSDLEVVIVDDGSTDQTRDIVQSIAIADERVRYVYQPNGGVSAARNRALAHCRGAMIAFLDSDDAWLPWKLKAQVGILEALPQVGMVWSDMNAVDVGGRVVFPNYLRRMYKAYGRLTSTKLFANTVALNEVSPDSGAPVPEASVSWGRIYSQMLFGNLVHTSTVLVRRERASGVGPFDEALRAGGEDYKFHLSTTRLGDVAFLDAATIEYRIGGDDQITNIRRNQVAFASAFLCTLEEQIQRHRTEIELTNRELASIRSEAHDWLASALIESGQRGPAASHALQAIRQRAVTPTAWKTLVKTMLPRAAVDLVRATRRVSKQSTAASM
jgi:glycosyltransferase involved in cell wall biosynthesis